MFIFLKSQLLESVDKFSFSLKKILSGADFLCY